MQISTFSLLTCAAAAACWLAVSGAAQTNPQPSANTPEPFGGLPPPSPPVTAAKSQTDWAQFSQVPPASPPSSAPANWGQFGQLPPSSPPAVPAPAQPLPKTPAQAAPPVTSPATAPPPLGTTENTAAPARPGNRTAASDRAVAATAQPTTTPAPELKTAPPRGPLAFKPLQPPPLPISLEKQNQLADLLRQYKADQISPEQYHAQRSKILAAP